MSFLKLIGPWIDLSVNWFVRESSI